ncbi:MAG: spermidine synthase [Elusimicrobia bacterium]|nr:spermidine synthase [Elusimicrobiota bacterium]
MKKISNSFKSMPAPQRPHGIVSSGNTKGLSKPMAKKTAKQFDWLKTSETKLPKGKWFVEWFSEGEFHAHKILRVIASSQTKFQKATLLETNAFGTCLVIDSETQSCKFDEVFYHESLVCPAIITHPNPKTALILGGGEGATARDILNAKSIENLIMVDIDREIVEFAKKFMPSWHRGSFKNTRMKLLVQDAKKFVEETKNKFDIIYSDLPSPIEGGPAFEMYTLEFYKTLKKKLNKNGIFAAQSGPGTPLQFKLHPAINNTLKKVFKVVRSYMIYIPSYDMPWAFTFCADNRALDPLLMKAPQIDKLISQKFKNEPKFIDGETIIGMFSIPKYHRKLISQNKQTIRKNKPMFFTTSYGQEEKKHVKIEN